VEFGDKNQHSTVENGFHFFQSISWDAYNEVDDLIVQQKKY